MNNINEDNEDQFANGQNSRHLRVSSDATELETQLDVVNLIEQCSDVEREWKQRGSQLLPNQIDADERLPGYLREPHLHRFESRTTRKFAKRSVLQGDPLSVLPPSPTNDAANTVPISDQAVC
jgi:hypothetical protein